MSSSLKYDQLEEDDERHSGGDNLVLNKKHRREVESI